jgi:choline dehydrogenase-like flavoprotein
MILKTFNHFVTLECSMSYKKNSIVLPFFLYCFQLFSKDAGTLVQAIQAKYCTSAAEYDYIVVGIGTAGAVVANKLTADNKTSLLGIHSGANLTQDPLIKFSRNAPLAVLSTLTGSPFSETGLTPPQPNADNNELFWVIGKPEGGASSINIEAWARATNIINAQWEAIAGPNWSVSRITEIYKELENYQGKTTNAAVRGTEGPLPIRQAPFPTQVSIKFTNAIIKATNLPFVLDYNDPNTPVGASTQFQYTQSLPNGDLRASSVATFLNDQVMTPDGHGVNGRKLRILFNTPALRTIWDGTTARGVEYLQDGAVQKAFARKGVIVCAGLRSSAFLLYSGVGSRKLLEPLNIPVVFDNPNVGQAFADQVLLVLAFSTNPADTPIPRVDPNNNLNQIAWLPNPKGDQTKRIFHLATLNFFPGIATALLSLCQTKSRGSITINSADPLQPPVVDLKIFSNSEDLEVYQNAMHIYIKNINTQLQKIDPLYRLIFPDPAILDDPRAVTQFLKDFSMSNQCFQSHCRMAPQDQGGVVDSTGHVYGVKNLIVADDSIVPKDMDGTPMATAYLIGANIARLLLESNS